MGIFDKLFGKKVVKDSKKKLTIKRSNPKLNPTVFILFIYLFQSCITLHVIPNEIGMSLDEFLQTKDNHCELKLVEKSDSNTIYSSGFTNDDRVYLYHFNEKNILYKIDKKGYKNEDDKK